MGLIGQGFTEVCVDLEEGFPEHLTIQRELELADGEADSEWFVLRLDFSPTSNLRLVADNLDQISALAAKLLDAVAERRRRDALSDDAAARA